MTSGVRNPYDRTTFTDFKQMVRIIRRRKISKLIVVVNGTQNNLRFFVEVKVQDSYYTHTHWAPSSVRGVNLSHVIQYLFDVINNGIVKSPYAPEDLRVLDIDMGL